MADKRLNTQNVLVGLLVAAALAVGFLYGKVQTLEKTGGNANAVVNNADQPAEEAPKLGDVEKVTDKDHIRGDLKTAKVVLIEYSDLECPFCSSFHSTAKQAVESYGKDVAWIYRHFPLSQIHPNAQKYAEASECAFEMGGEKSFWSFIDKMFTDQSTMTQATLPSVAKAVGLNEANFKKCLDSGKHAKKVDEHYQGGVKAGVTGTPGNIIMNLKTGKAELIPGAVPLESLKASIDAALK